MFKYMLGTDNPDDEEYEKSNNQKVVSSRFLYEKMMGFPEFRKRFLTTYATFLGDFLRPDVCLPIVNEMENEIVDELAPTFAAYDNMSTLKKHNTYLDLFCKYITERPTIVYQQMADYFSLGNVIPVSIQNDENENAGIFIGDTPLRTGRFDGAWFTEFPLTLRTDGGDVVWTMTVKYEDGRSDTYTYDTAEIQSDLTICEQGDVVTFMLTHETVTEITSVSNNIRCETYFDLTGKKKSALHQGVNIVLTSDGTRKKVVVK